MRKKIQTLITTLIILLISCDFGYEYDNLADKLSENYQGFETVTDIKSMSVVQLTSESTTLSWSEVVGATKYHLLVGKDSSFTTTYYNNDKLTTNTAAINTLGLNEGENFCKIRVFKDSWGEWSSVQSFTTANITEPTNGSPSSYTVLTDTTPTLSWDAVTGATGYELQVNTAEDFTGTEVISDNTLTTNSYTLTTALDNNSNYYWRVKQKDANGVWSDWSSISSFSVDLEEPTTGSPSSDTTITDTTPTLSWDAVTGATAYAVEINTAEDFTGTEVISDNTLTTSSYTLTTALDNNSNYYWRVKQKDANGVWSDWSDIFVIKYLYIVGEYGPSGGYIFYVDEDNSFADWDYLEAAPEDISDTMVWGTYSSSVSGVYGTAVGTGAQNTLDSVARDTTTSRAAHACANYSVTVGDTIYDDWFLPSKDELDVMYDNLKVNGLGGFEPEPYWSSSQYEYDNAWLQYFNNGYQTYFYYLYAKGYVRPVRAF